MNILKLGLAAGTFIVVQNSDPARASVRCDSLFSETTRTLTIDEAVEKIFMVLPEFGVKWVGVGADNQRQEVLVVGVDSTVDVAAQPKIYEGFNVRYEPSGDQPIFAYKTAVDSKAPDFSKFTSNLLMNPALVRSTTQFELSIRLQDGLTNADVERVIGKLGELGITVTMNAAPRVEALAVWGQIEQASLLAEVTLLDGQIQLAHNRTQ